MLWMDITKEQTFQADKKQLTFHCDMYERYETLVALRGQIAAPYAMYLQHYLTSEHMRRNINTREIAPTIERTSIKST